MKKILLFSLVVTILFSQCTPKVGEVAKTSETPVETPVEKPVEAPKQTTFRSSPPPAGPAPRIQMGTYEQFKLDNGLQVIVVENHKLPRVSYQLFVDVPPLVEGDKAGTSQIAGDLLNKGTKTRSKSEIDESIDFIGASLSTNANGMFGASLKKYNKELLELMSDVLLNPSFPESEFDKIKKQYASGLASEKTDPDALSGNLSSKLKYGSEHAYGEFMTESTLENIKLDAVKNFYKQWFKPGSSYLVIVGDITKAEAEPLAKKYFSGWKSEGKDAFTYTEPVDNLKGGNQVSFINKPGAVQSVINVTYPIMLKPGTEDVIKASVMNTVLGAGVYFGNRLNQNLREENAFTYGARSSLSSDKYVGSFAAGASVRNEVTDSSIVEIFNEFNHIRNVRVDEEELQKVKNVLSGSFGRSLESPETIARFALNVARYNLPKDYYATYLEKLSKVTTDDVMAMAKKYIRPENAHIVVVGNQDEVADKLKRFSKNGKVDFYDTSFEKIVAKKKEIPAGTTAETVINDYLAAIGGEKEITKIKSVETKMKGSLQGMTISIEIYQQLPNKYASLTSLNGNVMSAEIYNGTKGMITGMNGPQAADEDDLKGMKEKVNPFRERLYKENGYKVELAGIESIDGKDCYKVKVLSPSGSKTTDYYDMETSLRIRTVITEEQDGQSVTQTVDIGDYKMVDGIQYPHNLKISGGGMPMTLDMKAESIKVNGVIDPSIFNVE